MAAMIDLLRGEHRDIRQMLDVLEEELSVFNRQQRPDYHVIEAIISYFQDYPDCCHHPKEDMIFEKLKARDPAAAERAGDLRAEHRGEHERLQRVAQIVRNILLDRDILRQTVDAVMRDFIDQQRAHMAMEEDVLFPAVIGALRPEDWAEIDSQWSETKDSLFNVGIEERCESLRDRVLRWHRETMEQRI
jgi:hemerythrin-like domain-containing protein